MDEAVADPELAELRARHRRELLTRHGPQGTSEVRSVSSVALDAVSWDRFLKEHAQVVVDVWAPWCGPCRAMAPLLEQLAREFGPAVHFAKLNADEEPGLASRWNVEGIPTLLLFEHGRPVDRIVGLYPVEALRSRLRSAFGASAPSTAEVG